MNLMKYKVLFVGGGIALLLALGASIGLFHFQHKYSKVASDLKSANDRLDRLNRRNPFPSPENTTVVQQNRDKMNDFVSNLQQDFRKGQVGEESMEPAQFATFLETIRRDVRAKATGLQVKLPDQLSLGFARYVAGELPAAPDIPRLSVQAREAAGLCTVLFDARIDELVDLQRTQFEGMGGDRNPGAAYRAEGGAAGSMIMSQVALPPIESNELCSAERYGIVFLGREHAVWEALGGLSRCGLFVVVRHVELANEVNPKTPGGYAAGRPMEQAPPPMAGQPGATIVYPPREERVIAGREPVRVSLVVDIYRFAAPAGMEASS